MALKSFKAVGLLAKASVSIIEGSFQRKNSPLDQLHIETQRLQLPDEDVERLGQPRLGRDLSLDDRLVDRRAAFDVVGLDREELLEGVGGAVRLESPHFHLSETLAAELRLAAERLLRDERVRPDRAGVDLVVHQVREL